MANQRLLGGKIEPARACSRRDNQRVCLDDLAADLQFKRVPRQVHGIKVGHPQLRAKADRLLLHVLDQLRSLDTLGPAGKVFNQRRNGELSAGFVALEHEGLQVRAGGVDGGGESGATGTQDDSVACRIFGHIGSLSVYARPAKRIQRWFWCKNWSMANLTLVYGMRLLPADEIAAVGEAPIKLKNGNEAHVTMHVLEGSREQIEAQLRMSLDAFFDFYPEI